MTETKKENLKRRLLDAAEEQIKAHGVAALRARDVTKAAKCALGSLYTAYADLDLLILSVNARTIARLQKVLETAAEAHDAPDAQLHALALGYLDFAIAEPTLWAALFDHQMPPETEVPDWHLQEHAELISVVVGPLGRLHPDLGTEVLALRARTIFAAVHGIVKLSLENRFVALHPDVLQAELTQFITQYLAGAATRPA